MADERPIADVIRELSSHYDRDQFPVHVMVNVKEQRVNVTVGRSERRVVITFHRTAAPAAEIESIMGEVLSYSGHLYRQRLR